MHTYDVIVWQDSLSDGSTGYSAWCSYVLGVWGQGDTEDEALADIAKAMADIIAEPWDDGKSLADEKEAETEMASLMKGLSDEAIPYRVHRVSVPAPAPAVI